MPRRPILAHAVLAASLLTLCCAAGAQSGIIRFSGMIVEPPCSFSLDADQPGRPQLRSDCPRPATGDVSLVDPGSRTTLRTVRFTQLTKSIGLPAGKGGSPSAMIAIVTYQ
ncbi:type 1 fimbrial protein [Burkholderia alba]|uniref:type 1 fimbrial protein n=1 Tax=Burkholderia alba TaxID=2683677 RepID=UPI002B059264|nr:type 1 fimbrial protein [Burkholderia alba]